MNLIVSSFYNPGHSPISTVLCNHEINKYSLLEHCTKQVVTQYAAVAQSARNLRKIGYLFLRVALQFVHDMQERAHKNSEASRDRSLPVFGVGVVFIDESVVFPFPSHEMEEAVEAISLNVSSLAPPRKEFHFVPIETVYSSDSSDGKKRLIELMNVVSDPTGREDVLLSLRMLALQKVASEFGYNRIVLGTCISRIAAHVVSATVKGQGYPLLADIQYVDARWEIPVVLPLRDCFVQEINMFCCLDRKRTHLKKAQL
ncbi:hypothetical protein RYX36_030924 [Vicia faba]